MSCEITAAQGDYLLRYRDLALTILAKRDARVGNLILNCSDCDITDRLYMGRWLSYRQVVSSSPEPQLTLEVGSASRDRFEYYDLELHHPECSVSVSQKGFGNYAQTYDHRVELSEAVPSGGTLRILAVALVGTDVWCEVQSHREYARLNTRNEWNGSISCGGGIAQAHLWRRPRQTVVYAMTPAPVQVRAEDGRVSTFFVLSGSDGTAANVAYHVVFEHAVCRRQDLKWAGEHRVGVVAGNQMGTVAEVPKTGCSLFVLPRNSTRRWAGLSPGSELSGTPRSLPRGRARTGPRGSSSQ